MSVLRDIGTPDGYEVERIGGGQYRFTAPNGDTGKPVRNADVAAHQAERHNNRHKTMVRRNCLKCGAEFEAPTRFIRLCSPCKARASDGMI